MKVVELPYLRIDGTLDEVEAAVRYLADHTRVYRECYVNKPGPESVSIWNGRTGHETRVPVLAHPSDNGHYHIEFSAFGGMSAGECKKRAVAKWKRVGLMSC
jgi:hypothetical protein